VEIGNDATSDGYTVAPNKGVPTGGFWANFLRTGQSRLSTQIIVLSLRIAIRVADKAMVRFGIGKPPSGKRPYFVISIPR
jgi:hypothetical protein